MTIGCYIYNTMVDWEVTFACSALKSSHPEAEIITFGDSETELDQGIETSSGFRILPKTTAENILNGLSLDGLIIPGGFDRKGCEPLFELIRILHENKKMLAAICAAPEFFAKAGILDDHRYTTVLAEEYYQSENLADPFPRDGFTNQDLTVCGHLITAKYNAFMPFATAVKDYWGLYQSEDEKKADLNPFVLTL